MTYVRTSIAGHTRTKGGVAFKKDAVQVDDFIRAGIEMMNDDAFRPNFIWRGKYSRKKSKYTT